MGSPGAHFGSKLGSTKGLKTGYIEFAMAGNLVGIGIQLLLTQRVSYC